jgi:hypothetical protein
MKKENEKHINYNDTSLDEFDKRKESEEEKGNEEELPFNIDNESNKILRANWKNEVEMHVSKTIPRIISRHFKKIKSGLNLVMNRVAAIFRMIKDTEEKDEEFIQEPYTNDSFLLSKQIREKIGKKLRNGNVYRNNPKTRVLKEEIEGKDTEKDLN